MKILVETALGYNIPPDLKALNALLEVIAENLNENDKIEVRVIKE